MIRGIAFDLFDTLVDQDHELLLPVEVEGRRVSSTTPQLFRHVTQYAGISLSLGEFADLQREVDRELFRETLKEGIECPTLRRFEALVERLGHGRDLTLAAGLTTVHMSALREAVTIPAHHEAILAALAAEHRLALCSNFSHAETAHAILDEASFTQHLASVVISEEIGIRKPRREIFDAVVRCLDLAPEEILHVGDSLRADVAGAAACGMRTVWLTRQIADPDADLEAYEGPRPEFALEDLIDLPVLAARLSA
ncbi:MAG: HAD family hydrolase [Deltaproteobacteria bacterium]|nr:HAD family hydrolase [Deltaproteobacteria bacterium]